jgi:hypothetical protein
MYRYLAAAGGLPSAEILASLPGQRIDEFVLLIEVHGRSRLIIVRRDLKLSALFGAL